MKLISQVLIVIVAIEHLYILWLEMFAWNTAGRKIFKSFPAELFEPTKSLAANQGLYNGFLAAGLIWSLLITDSMWSSHIAFFFLGCVTVAGIYGGITVQRSIFFVQSVPAILAIGIKLLLMPA